jgi:hypothetical protein
MQSHTKEHNWQKKESQAREADGQRRASQAEDKSQQKRANQAKEADRQKKVVEGHAKETKNQVSEKERPGGGLEQEVPERKRRRLLRNRWGNSATSDALKQKTKEKSAIEGKLKMLEEALKKDLKKKNHNGKK